MSLILEADLYAMIGQVVDEVASQLSSFSFKNEYIYKLVFGLCKCVQAYVESLVKLCLQGLSRDMGEGHGKGPENSSSLCGFLRATYIQVTYNLRISS